MPDISPCEHIVDYLFEVGPTTGEHSVEPTQLEAWQRLTGIVLNEFEAVQVLQLSKSYLSMLHEAREENCPPPYRVERTAEDKRRAAKAIREALHGSVPESTNKGMRKRENAKS